MATAATVVEPGALWRRMEWMVHRRLCRRKLTGPRPNTSWNARCKVRRDTPSAAQISETCTGRVPASCKYSSTLRISRLAEGSQPVSSGGRDDMTLAAMHSTIDRFQKSAVDGVRPYLWSRKCDMIRTRRRDATEPVARSARKWPRLRQV